MREDVVAICAIISALSATISLAFSIANHWTISIVHRATNSMKDELVRATKIASELVGEARGRQLQKDEDK